VSAVCNCIPVCRLVLPDTLHYSSGFDRFLVSDLPFLGTPLFNEKQKDQDREYNFSVLVLLGQLALPFCEEGTEGSIEVKEFIYLE
jgi:hypothetical protein